ncbi:hypothetical protein KL937_002003 [Ogataea polymorpha]|nr:hypothetical protein KL937_002003 [Ogataea polymorpha]KAG7889237.1 hypothetical protein KL936_002811 [Ogataea polymorpha]KAG7935873.1 hypothetical protein KL904_002521 [Ogataea polymorpha]
MLTSRSRNPYLRLYLSSSASGISGWHHLKQFDHPGQILVTEKLFITVSTFYSLLDERSRPSESDLGRCDAKDNRLPQYASDLHKTFYRYLQI